MVFISNLCQTLRTCSYSLSLIFRWDTHLSMSLFLLCSISQEPYIIWLSFVVHMCKMISPHVFFIFQNFDFTDYQGAERAKNGPKWQKNLSVTPFISGTIYHMSFICSTQICIKGWYLQAFTLFSSKIWFLGSLGGTG